MQRVDQGLWSVPSDLRFGGLQLNTRMTVCGLSEGGLVLISPVPFTLERKAALERIGEVRAIVSPNLLHHLSLGEWMNEFPDAKSFGPAGLSAKRSDLEVGDELGPQFDALFGADLQRWPIDGMPKLNESLFFHRASGGLIATDFCFFIPRSKGLTRLFTALMGIDQKAKCEPRFRALVRDRSAFRKSLAPLRDLEVRHLSMCHDSVLSDGADQALQRILDQLKVP